VPPYFGTAEAIGGFLGAIGIRTKLRTMERAAYYAALATKKLKGVCFCSISVYGNASTRMSEVVPSNGVYAYGGYPDIDDLYRKQLNDTNGESRAATLHQIQRTLHERTRFAPIWDYFWPSGIGPRVVEVSLMKIDPFPWSAPLEDVRLKRP
jgi:peptide/nickel transport system substrate-binding protein